jgi:transcriptional regulator with XRE-family HTH domain
MEAPRRMREMAHESGTYPERFADRLRRLRMPEGLTQEVLAERSGVSVATIAALEQGLRRRPYPHTLAALSQGLELEAAERAALFALGAAARSSVPSVSAEAPPSADAPTASRARLPLPPTGLIGRETDVADIAKLLRARNPARLVTLIGPGGVGKTRLALAVAEEVAADYRDGVVFVDLTPLRDDGLIAGSIASALGVYESGGHRVSELIIRHLRERQVLLVLDNVEQVVNGVRIVGELLGECPQVAVLATSRIALRLRAEVRFAVEPLGQPPGDGQVVGRDRGRARRAPVRGAGAGRGADFFSGSRQRRGDRRRLPTLGQHSAGD